ncbi:MAG: chorismate mutase [Candidatus Tectomicrobia bacterium]|nr:chorismate mutase [Candidatus Tectomicrobia bacterium]
MGIDEIRKKIDQIDNQILQLLNERAKLAVQIGEVKKARNLEITDQTREQQILERIRQENPGPLSAEAITRLYEKVIEESKRLEREMTHQKISD